jgi:hypothetical protein
MAHIMLIAVKFGQVHSEVLKGSKPFYFFILLVNLSEMENQSIISASTKKVRWFVRVNQRINTVSGYIHIGMLQGVIMAVMLGETALFCVGSMILTGIFWGIGGYFKFKFRSKPNPITIQN